MTPAPGRAKGARGAPYKRAAYEAKSKIERLETKMKNTKKLLSVVLTIALVIGLLPGMTLTANADTFSGSAGANLTWTLDASTGLLSISGTGPMDEWRAWIPTDTPGQARMSPYAPWHRHRESIRSVHIAEGVTTIGSNAFLELGNITAVNIPASVTHIGGGAFSESGITSITIPSTVKRISEGAFNRCSRLTHVTIGAEYLGMDPTEVDRLGFHLFNNQSESKGLDSITHVTIQGSVKQIPAASFIWLLNLESLRIEEGVTKIHTSAFMNCISLPSVTLPNSLTAIGFQTFAGTDSLTSITIPRNVTSIDTGAFRGNEGRIITLRGYANSAAQTHANRESQFGIRFEAITGDLPDVLPGGTTTPPTIPPPAQEIKVLVNGSALTFDQPPIIENGRTLVPLRAIFEALGATVEWEQSTQTVTAVKDDITIILKIGDAFLTKNGERIALDVPAKIVGGRTLVPARAVAESFGADVQWDQATRTVTITE